MSDRFFREYRQRQHFQQRPGLPGPTRIAPTMPGIGATTIELFYQDREIGYVTYYTGIVHQLFQPQLAANAPYLYQPVVPGNPAMPRLLIITDFHSDMEHRVKGIGSAMLRELLRLAEQAECRYILVTSGINHEVYTALGFDLIEPGAETWCMPIGRLRARLSPLRRAREAP